MDALYTVSEIPSKGNGVLAARDLESGTFLFSCEPVAAFIDDTLMTCAWCFATESNPMKAALGRKCLECKRVRYCSDRCRELARRPHESFACAIEQRAPKFGDAADDIYTVAMMEAIHDASTLDGFEELCSIKQHDVSHLQAVAKGASGVLERPVTVERSEAILGKISANCFGLDVPMAAEEFNEDGERDVDYVGRAVYPQGSYFNHSCAPNVVRVRMGREMSFFTVKPVSKGQELCITYVNQVRLQNRTDRRALLREEYHFDCNCSVCANESAVPSGKLCDNCGCSAFLERFCCVCDADSIYKTFKQD